MEKGFSTILPKRNDTLNRILNHDQEYVKCQGGVKFRGWGDHWIPRCNPYDLE